MPSPLSVARLLDCVIAHNAGYIDIHLYFIAEISAYSLAMTSNKHMLVIATVLCS